MQSDSGTAHAKAVYVAKDGQPTGPFSIDQLKTMLAEGSLAGSDLAWHEGAIGWIAVAELLREPGVVPAPPLPSAGVIKSRADIAGSIIGFAGIPIWLVILVVAGVSQKAQHGSKSLTLMFVGFSVFAMVGVNVVGAVLGFIAAAKKPERKRLIIAGLVLNVVQVLGILLLVIIGLSVK